MKIQKLVPQKYRKQYFTVFVEGSDSFKLHEELIAKYDIREGMDLSEENMNELKFSEEKKEALDYAYLLLGYRDRSSKEISQRLNRKGFSGEAVDAVVQGLKERSLIDDSTLAKELAESKIKYKLMGQNRIKQDLFRKGIDITMAEKAIQEVQESKKEEILDENERAYQSLIKRSKQIKTDDYRTFYRRIFDYLGRRGFNYDTIEKALSRYKREQKEIERKQA